MKRKRKFQKKNFIKKFEFEKNIIRKHKKIYLFYIFFKIFLFLKFFFFIFF